MKKRSLAAALGIAAVMTVCACGKSEKEQAKEYYQEELGLTEEEAEEVADFVYSEEATPTEAPEEEGKAVKEYRIYDKASGWANATLADAYLQIDDVLYPSGGVTIAELLELVESSEIDYDYEYNGSKLMNNGESEWINISRDGTRWIDVSVTNMEGETTPLSNCHVRSVKWTEASAPYCYFIDGIGYKEIMQMTYDGVKDYINRLSEENKYGVVSYEEKSNGTEEMSIEMKIENLAKIEAIDDEHFSADICRRVYTFTIDKNNGAVNKFELDNRQSYDSTTILEEQVCIFDTLPPETYERCIKTVKKGLKNAGIECESIDVSEEFIRVRQSWGDYYETGAIFELDKEGKKSYVAVVSYEWKSEYLDTFSLDISDECESKEATLESLKSDQSWSLFYML